MLKFSLGMTLLFLGLMDCAQNKKDQNSGIDKLRYQEAAFYKRECVGKDSVCAEVKIVFPEFSDGEDATWLNLHVKEQMMMYLTWEAEEENGVKPDSVGGLADKFLIEFVEYGQKFPESVQPWFNETKVAVSTMEGGTLSMTFANSNYTGGAHPNHTFMFLNFDLEKQRVLKNNDLILDQNGLLVLVEKAFREFHEVDPKVSLEEDGRFFLDEGRFFLPAAMGYEGEDFVMVYNSYEIGPYSMGQTEIRFPLSDLKGIVRQIKKGASPSF